MARIVVAGATGSLGRHIARQAVAAGHAVSVLVRNPAKLDPALAGQVRVLRCDLAAAPQAELAALLDGHDAVLNAAGFVADGEAFVALVDRLLGALESLPDNARPVCWFLAGAGLLDIDASGRRGVDLPRIRTTYWPHRANFERIRASTLDWRLLCPGPMVEQPALGVARLRSSLDCLPVTVPAFARYLPGALFLPVFARLVPQMIVPYADAAALMLANLAPGGPMSRHRVGIALPAGMRGRKDRWVSRPADAG